MNDYKNTLADLIEAEANECNDAFKPTCHANEIIDFVEKEIKKAEGRGKEYWEPSEHHKDIWRNEGYTLGYEKAQQMIDSVSLYNEDAIKATKQSYDNGYLKAIKECAAVDKQNDEIAFDNGYLKGLQDAREKIKQFDVTLDPLGNPVKNLLMNLEDVKRFILQIIDSLTPNKR